MPWYPCKSIQGAKSVWIGDQTAYNEIPAAEIDPQICYIIMARGNVVRCYAGSVIIYDQPIIWDYVINNKVITPGVLIDTNLCVDGADALDLTWEYYLKCHDLDGGKLIYGYIGYETIPPQHVGTRPTSQALPRMGRDSSMGLWYNHWWWTGAQGRAENNVVPYTDHFYVHVVKPEINGSVLVSYFDDETGNEIQLNPIPATNMLQIDGRTVVFGWRDTIAYTIDEFKFRWLT